MAARLLYGQTAGPRAFRDLLSGSLQLSHESLDSVTAGSTRIVSVNYLRRLLVDAGALPSRDEHLHRFEAQADNLIKTTPTSYAPVLTQYFRWHLLPRLRHRITTGVASASAVQGPATKLHATHRFVSWLSDQGVAPAAVNQALIERWCADQPGRRTPVAGFVTWASRRHLIGSVEVLKARVEADWSPLHLGDPDQLYAAARRCLTDDTLAMQVRFAAALVLLYGQPANKISRLRLRDLALTRDGVLTVRLGTTPLALPPILAEISSHLIADVRRPSPGVCGLGAGDWLFPSQRASRPMLPSTLRNRIRPLLPTGWRPVRNTALLNLAAQVPPSALTDLLGLHRNTAANWRQLAGGGMNTYVATKLRA